MMKLLDNRCKSEVTLAIRFITYNLVEYMSISLYSSTFFFLLFFSSFIDSTSISISLFP